MLKFCVTTLQADQEEKDEEYEDDIEKPHQLCEFLADWHDNVVCLSVCDTEHCD